MSPETACSPWRKRADKAYRLGPSSCISPALVRAVVPREKPAEIAQGQALSGWDAAGRTQACSAWRDTHDECINPNPPMEKPTVEFSFYPLSSWERWGCITRRWGEQNCENWRDSEWKQTVSYLKMHTFLKYTIREILKIFLTILKTARAVSAVDPFKDVVLLAWAVLILWKCSQHMSSVCTVQLHLFSPYYLHIVLC